MQVHTENPAPFLPGGVHSRHLSYSHSSVGSPEPVLIRSGVWGGGGEDCSPGRHPDL